VRSAAYAPALLVLGGARPDRRPGGSAKVEVSAETARFILGDLARMRRMICRSGLGRPARTGSIGGGDRSDPCAPATNSLRRLRSVLVPYQCHIA